MDKNNKYERDYAQLSVEEKESYKWLNCVDNSYNVLQSAASVTVVGDRESDMYELFADAKVKGINVLARSRINRRTPEGMYIDQVLEQTPESGTFDIEVIGDKRKSTTTRVATIAVKFCEITINKPIKKGMIDPNRPRCGWWKLAKNQRTKPFIGNY